MFDNKNHAVFNMDYHKEVKIDGTIIEYIHTDMFTEYKEHLGSSCGGGSQYSTDEELAELYDNILEWFKNHFDIPYVDFGIFNENWYSFFVSDIKTEDVNLEISESAKDFLKRKNFPLAELMEKIKELRKQRKQFTKDYQDKIEMYKDLEKFVDDTEHEVRDLVDSIIDKGKTLNKHIDLKGLWKQIDDLIEQLKDVDDEYSKLHTFFFGWDRHTTMVGNDECWFWKKYNKAKEIVFDKKEREVEKMAEDETIEEEEEEEETSDDEEE